MLMNLIKQNAQPPATDVGDRNLFGAQNDTAAHFVYLSNDGTNPKVIFGSTTGGGTSLLYYFDYTNPGFVPIDGNNIHYKVGGYTHTLYVRAYKFSLGR